MLLALATHQRAQTLHSICIDNIIFSKSLVVIPITKMLKHTTVRKPSFSINLKRYIDSDLCVINALELYLKQTETIRKSRNLFISFQRPHGAVSVSTISRWIKNVLKEAGIDTDIFKAHSTRSASSVKALSDQKDINEISKDDGWSKNRIFEKYYCEVFQAE